MRLAVPSDEDELMEMYRSRHAEVVMANVDLDEERVRHALRRGLCLQKGNDGTYAGYPLPAWIGAIGGPGCIEGAAYVALELPWDSSHPILVERWNYVLPAYRKSSNSQELIAFSKGMADALQIYPLIMTSTDREAAKWRIYTRKMGAPVGATFVYGCEARHGHI